MNMLWPWCFWGVITLVITLAYWRMKVDNRRMEMRYAIERLEAHWGIQSYGTLEERLNFLRETGMGATLSIQSVARVHNRNNRTAERRAEEQSRNRPHLVDRILARARTRQAPVDTGPPNRPGETLVGPYRPVQIDTAPVLWDHQARAQERGVAAREEHIRFRRAETCLRIARSRLGPSASLTVIEELALSYMPLTDDELRRLENHVAAGVSRHPDLDALIHGIIAGKHLEPEPDVTPRYERDDVL